ncbi:hypothetical protein HPB52_025334 [Rhipicephalus sanguineus]|uniref:Uncharacterized protein n=1 Tax=Rhipicephalus sanguineus TaxID=34632 RepID=A0A9D4TD73_RHISA|nr:hypothetical protein HPB52_025334 [Rhipicephalus sanguineus]
MRRTVRYVERATRLRSQVAGGLQVSGRVIYPVALEARHASRANGNGTPVPQCTRGDPIVEPTLRLANEGLRALKYRQNPSLMGGEASSATLVISVATPREHATRATRHKGLLARREKGHEVGVTAFGLIATGVGFTRKDHKQFQGLPAVPRLSSATAHQLKCTLRCLGPKINYRDFRRKALGVPPHLQ